MVGQENSHSEDGVSRAFTGALFKGGPADLYERFVANEWDPERAIRAYTPLMRDEQIRFDTAVVKTFQERIRVTRRLIELGLVDRIDNPFRVSEVEYSSEDDGIGVGIRRSMSPIPRADYELPALTPNRVPIYFTSGRFQLDLRSLETSRNKGMPLDTTIAIRKSRAIALNIEDAVINGPDMQVSGYATHGFLDAPGLQTVTTALGWQDPNKTGAMILQDITDAMALAEAKQAYGPYDLVLSTAWYSALRGDFKAFGERTILDRIRGLEAGGDNLYIYVADKVPFDTAILYPRAIENVRLFIGNLGGARAPEQQEMPQNQITPISLFPWDTDGGFTKNWLVTAVVIPNMRTTGTGQSGIIRIISQVS